MSRIPLPNSQPDAQLRQQDIEGSAQAELQGTSRHLFFDDADAILCSSFQVTSPAEELSQVKSVLQGTREEALRLGVRLQNQRYEIHQYEPSIVYGRTMSGDPDQSEGIAVCKVAQGPTGLPTYGVVTFMLPELTANQVPQLLAFCRAHLEQQ